MIVGLPTTSTPLHLLPLFLSSNPVSKMQSSIVDLGTSDNILETEIETFVVF